MKHLVLIGLLVSALLWSCAQHSAVRPPSEESLAFVEQVRQNQQARAHTFDVNQLLPRLEEFCDRGLQLPAYSNVDSLRADMQSALALDSTLIFLPLQQQRYIDFIAGSEFLYRFLQAAQVRLEDYFQANQQRYGESYTSNDGELVFHFEQNVSDMLPVTQSHADFSEKRAQLLNRLLDQYPHLQTDSEKQRFWLAVRRMLQPIDLARSETGYDMFQRRADGLAGKPSALLARLQAYEQQESSETVKQHARAVLQNARQNLQSPLSHDDKVMINTVELNRSFFQELQSDSLRQNQQEKQDISTWFERGFETENPRLKIEYYTRVISLDSTHAAAFNNRGNAYQAVGDYAAAASDFNRALELDPEFQIAYKNRGSLLLLQQKYADAISDLSRAIDLDPICALCFADRGKAYLNLLKYSEALQDFDRAVQLDPTRAYSWNYRGLCLQKVGREEEALENFDRALQLDAGFTQAYINRGNVYRQMENDKQAISDYTAALALEPDNVIALNSRAISYRNLRQYDAAIADHNRALDIRPDDPMTLYNLGCVYWEQHNWPEVVANWQRVLEKEPEHRLVNEWLPTAQRQLEKRH